MVPVYGGGASPMVPVYGGGVSPMVPVYGGGVSPMVPVFGFNLMMLHLGHHIFGKIDFMASIKML